MDTFSKDIVVTDADGTYTVDETKIEWIDPEASTMGYDGELYKKSDENDTTIFYDVWDA